MSKNYSDIELHELINEPWEFSDKPLMLFTSYALNCLIEAAQPNEDEDAESFNFWGSAMPENIYDSVINNSIREFCDAAANGGKIDIKNRIYSVRKLNEKNKSLLDKIFSFQKINGGRIMDKSGVLKVSAILCKDGADKKTELTKNRNFLRAVIMIAEDDKNGGWDKLTDMEIAIYCWALFYHRERKNDLQKFISAYKDYLYVSKKDIISCWIGSARAEGKPSGMYTFDAERTQEWNCKNNQKSIIKNVSENDAYDYWYETAIKGTFKPV